MAVKNLTMQTVLDSDTELTLGEMIHLEVEHTLSKLGIMKTYSEKEARKLLLEEEK